MRYIFRYDIDTAALIPGLVLGQESRATVLFFASGSYQIRGTKAEALAFMANLEMALRSPGTGHVFPDLGAEFMYLPYEPMSPHDHDEYLNAIGQERDVAWILSVAAWPEAKDDHHWEVTFRSSSEQGLRDFMVRMRRWVQSLPPDDEH